jgi:hypothetical protein
MSREWVQSAMLGAASILVPRDRRAEWMEEWRNELWYVPANEATRFSLGAFRDAFWLRRNHVPAKRTGVFLESPAGCLALLATAATASVLIAARLERMLPSPERQGGATVGATVGAFASMLLIYLLPAVISLAVGGQRPTPSSRRLRGWIFLALKILLVLPIVQCTILIVMVLAPFLSLGLFLANAVLFRWVFLDQRRRCPVCLRLLAQPVRIGNSSQTFLEWYGAESVCARGHGLLQDPEILASYSSNPRWLALDRSWSGLFSGVSMR